MLSLIKIEINKVSKSKLLLAWFVTLLIVSGVTGIIIMGLGTDNKLGEFVGQSSNDFRIADKWGNWAIATSLFSSLFTKAAFLIFEAYLLSTIFIDEFKQRTIFQLFSYPISKIKLLWGKVISVILISFIAHFTAHVIIQLLINLVGISFGTVLIGVLPFVIGMIKYSTPITMLSGLGLAALLTNATPGSLTNNFLGNPLFLIFASFISIIIASVSIYNISRKDINIK